MDDGTLVLDIGKSNAKLVLIDSAGGVLARAHHANAAGPAQWEGRELAYRCLGVAALEAWLMQAIPALAQRARIGRISITTHGAAFCALGSDGLVLPPIDYEWDGYGDERTRFAAEVDGFDQTGSPQLPQGLTAGLQLHWLQRHMPEAWQKIRCWVPYPQVWAWWFSGVMATEVSSLGCHTALWSPRRAEFSHWARQRGIAALFAPVRPAWEVLGSVMPARARQLGLAADVQVHVGSHDSNACLARYLCRADDATVLSTGTWTIAMAAGAPIEGLDARRDQLVNVAVTGSPVPTARFMGGREFDALCAGADPGLADESSLRQVLAQGWMAHPAFAESGGPFIGRHGTVTRDGQAAALGPLAVPIGLRPALASLYGAEMSAWLLQRISGGSMADVILEGPLVDNPVFGLALAALLAPRRVLRSTDLVEGTARGAWLLSRWPTAALWPSHTDELACADPALAQRIITHAAAALSEPGL